MTNRDILSVDDGIALLEKQIENGLEANTSPIILAISGGIGSGKTYIAERLAKTFGKDTLHFKMDDYYRSVDEVNPDNIEHFNWDTPGTLNIKLFNNHLEAISQGRAIEKPIYCKETSKVVGIERTEPKRIILVDGAYVLHKNVSLPNSTKVFVVANDEKRLERKLVRDVLIRKKGTKEDILDYHYNCAVDAHKKYVEPTRKFADIIIYND